MSRAQVYDNVLAVIGQTPIVRIQRVVQGRLPSYKSPLGTPKFYGKLEMLNPGGSIKDRIGWWMIEDAERRGVLKPGGTVIESTSGNTGVGLAIAAAIKGYRCVFTLPDKMSQEKIKNLRAFGAKVIVTPTAVEADDPRSYYSVARQMAQDTPNSVYLNQYDNLSNRQCHYETTGPEILKQMPDIDVFVAGIGTGGTVCGVGRYLKEHKPSVEVVAVDPLGSIVYDYFKTGKLETRPKTYKLEGIGEDFLPKNYDFDVLTDMVQVEDKESFLMTREMLTREGLYIGVSCGAAMIGAIKWVASQGERMAGKNVLVILPDSGNRYLSKVYDDDWMREAGFLESPSLGTVADLIQQLKPSSGEIIMADPTERVGRVIERLRESGISQMPVRDAQGWIKGVIGESAILAALYEGRAKTSDPIERLVDPTIEFVRLDTPIERVAKLVTSGKTPLVQAGSGDSGELVAILTKIDVLSFLERRL